MASSPSSDDNQNGNGEKQPNNCGSSTSSSSNGSFFDKFWNSSFWNNDNVDMKQQIHDQLNLEEERRKQVQDFFRSHGGFGGLFGNGRRPRDNEEDDEDPFRRLFGDTASDLDKMYEKIHQELTQDFFGQQGSTSSGNRDGNQSHFERRLSSSSSSSSSSSPFHGMRTMTSYSMKQDSTGTTEVAIQLPRDDMTTEDVNLQVIQSEPSCVIQWNTNPNNKSDEKISNEKQEQQHPHPLFRFRQSGGEQRLKLGSMADCEKLSATLSNGILKLKAPPKEPRRLQKEQPRSIPITTTKEDD